MGIKKKIRETGTNTNLGGNTRNIISNQGENKIRILGKPKGKSHEIY